MTMNKRMKASEVRCESFLDKIYRIKKEQENEAGFGRIA